MKTLLKREDITDIGDETFVKTALAVFGITNEGIARRFKYRVPNINIKIFRDFFGSIRRKGILAVSGSAINLFTLFNNKKTGYPKYIVGFDMSPKQVAYNYFLKSALINLSHDEFLNLFGYHKKILNDKKLFILNRIVLEGVPKVLRSFMPRRYYLTVRDHKLFGNVQFSFPKQIYSNIQKNVGSAKFMIYNLLPNLRHSPSGLFSSGSFDIFYLSNALDWLCWHHGLTRSGLKRILKTLKAVSAKKAIVICEHLLNRPNFLDKWFSNIALLESKSYTLLKYRWGVYKFFLDDTIDKC